MPPESYCAACLWELPHEHIGAPSRTSLGWTWHTSMLAARALAKPGERWRVRAMPIGTSWRYWPEPLFERKEKTGATDSRTLPAAA